MTDSIQPQIYVDDKSACSAFRTTNCFAFQRCSIDGHYTLCNGTDWTASLTFTGTGVEVWGVTECGNDPCLWTLDGTTRAGDAIPDGSYRELAFVAKDLDGGPTAKHVLIFSASAVPKVSLRVLSARIFADSATSLHPEDRIWVPSCYEQVRYVGRWNTSLDGFQQTSEEGASVNVAFLGDEFSWFLTPDGTFGNGGFVESKTGIRARTYLDGFLGRFNDRPASPNYHDVSIILDFSNGGNVLEFQGLTFNPLPHMTVMGDAIPIASRESPSSSSTPSTTASIPTDSTTASIPTPSSTSESIKSNTGSIIGGVVGGAVFLSCIAAGMVMYLKKRRTVKEQTQSGVQPFTVTRSHPRENRRIKVTGPDRTALKVDIDPTLAAFHSDNANEPDTLPRQRSMVGPAASRPEYNTDERQPQVGALDVERMERLLRYVDDRIDAALDRPPLYSSDICV
ncbi:hypothetical protein BDV98DRAFT_272833 [Pterulicium gracile]|uniref:Uncharacterized protein n=1 Tax=Pterulicium gracile TaxID=1884261 RepID=A0A5C3Q516_9AGAR|nr:hypothetical protein BDV98DRAFT_272833 [Pterula gracilis]